MIKGRRRIGKTRLIQEFTRGKKALFFMGLAPDEKTTAQSQRDVVEFLARGPAEYKEIVLGIQYKSSGALSEYLDDLVLSGFVVKEFAWNMETGKERRIFRYRLRDNYLRFYLRMIAPRRNQIEQDRLHEVSVEALPGWNSVLGLQFENLVLNNRNQILAALNVDLSKVVYDNPYFQRKTQRKQGCQIDYLIQTQYKTLYVCEIKFNRNKIGSKVIADMQEKISRLSVPKGFACIPVLIHVGDLTDDVQDSGYFQHIIDLAALLHDDG